MCVCVCVCVCVCCAEPRIPVATQFVTPAVGCCGRGYHSDDGRLYAGSGVGADFGPRFGEGDTVGCGVFQADNDDLCFFFTKNGVLLGGTAASVLGGSGILASAYSTEEVRSLLPLILQSLDKGDGLGGAGGVSGLGELFACVGGSSYTHSPSVRYSILHESWGILVMQG